jgi:peptidoglycan/xylan/chitin deacetylase (PgdA/CDA1 family)
MKRAYLTIDDCPSRHMREKIDYLRSRNIPAILFCQGNYLEERPSSALYAIEKGYVLGNHSYDHQAFSRLDIGQCIDQIARTDGIIEKLYNEANQKRPCKCFRFPYGDAGNETNRQTIQDYLLENGYVNPRLRTVTYRYYNDLYGNNAPAPRLDWFWTYDVYEWNLHINPGLDPASYFKTLINRMDEGLNVPDSDEIILIHDHVESDSIFIPLIENLLSRNIAFITPVSNGPVCP